MPASRASGVRQVGSRVAGSRAGPEVDEREMLFEVVSYRIQPYRRMQFPQTIAEQAPGSTWHTPERTDESMLGCRGGEGRRDGWVCVCVCVVTYSVFEACKSAPGAYGSKQR